MGENPGFEVMDGTGEGGNGRFFLCGLYLKLFKKYVLFHKLIFLCFVLFEDDR